MKLIVGLGNPGTKYEQTRHNIGFTVASKVAALISASPSKARFEGEFADGSAGGEKVGILWPGTYMNASGQSVRKAFDFYKLAASDVLVLCDDLNLPSGRIRLRASGSAGGQKGLADIIRHLTSEEFPRLKIGIGRPPQGWEVTDYVLGKFSNEENDKIEECTTKAAKAAIDWVTLGCTVAMNRYNADSQLRASQKKSDNQAKLKTTNPSNRPIISTDRLPEND